MKTETQLTYNWLMAHVNYYGLKYINISDNNGWVSLHTSSTKIPLGTTIKSTLDTMPEFQPNKLYLYRALGEIKRQHKIDNNVTDAMIMDELVKQKKIRKNVWGILSKHT
jgi:hypothetical protein